LFLKDVATNTLLETWTGLTAPSLANTIPVVDAASVLHPLLTSGDTYTLIASANNQNTNDAWDEGFNTLHVGTVGFRVEGQVSTPEPASIVLLGSALVAFGGFHFRRWRRKPSTT
jgi:hypothetical protein